MKAKACVARGIEALKKKETREGKCYRENACCSGMRAQPVQEGLKGGIWGKHTKNKGRGWVNHNGSCLHEWEKKVASSG